MSAKTSRKTLGYQVRSQSLTDALRTFNPQVAPVLRDLYAVTRQEGEPETDWEFQLEQDVRQLEHVVAESIVADHARGEHLELRVEGVEIRDVRTGLLRAHLLGVARRLARTHGRRALRRFGLDGALPEEAAGLLNLAVEVRRRLNDEKIALPAPLLSLEALSRPDLAAELDEPIRLVEEALGDLGLRRQEASMALVTKREKQDRLRRTFVSLARRMVGTYRLAGFDDLADRLLAAVRQAVRPAPSEPPGGETPEGESPESQAPANSGV